SESLNKPAITRFERKVSIGDLFVVKAGKELPKFKISEDGRFPVYGGNGIIGRYEEFNLSGENILIGRVGANCGNVHYVKGPIWVTNNSFSVQLKSKQQVCIEYLVYALRNLNLNRLARGAAQQSISYSKIKDLMISLPSYEQQVELSKWFEKLESQKNALMDSLFEQKKMFEFLAS